MKEQTLKVSVPSRGTGNINLRDFKPCEGGAVSSFRPLSGNREYQLKGEEMHDAEKMHGFRPLSGNREYQRYGQISYFMIQGESIFPHLKHVAIVILNIRHRKTFSSHAEHSSEHGPYTKALHDPVIR